MPYISYRSNDFLIFHFCPFKLFCFSYISFYQLDDEEKNSGKIQVTIPQGQRTDGTDKPNKRLVKANSDEK